MGLNQRFFELAKQADLIQWDTLPSGARTPDYTSTVKARRFAENIIRECLDIIKSNTYGPAGEYDYSYTDKCVAADERAETIYNEIQQHFGVTE